MKHITVLILTLLLACMPGRTEDRFGVKAMYVDFRTEVRTLSSLKELASQAAGLGFNTMLMEYEATFPFDRHATLQNRYAFTEDEIREFVSWCTDLGLDVIPLQNCMGYAQYILRHDRYAALREDPKDMSQVCPLKIDEAVPVFTEIFSEVAALHPSRYFHIGCDETFLLGSCPECAEYAAEFGKSKLSRSVYPESGFNILIEATAWAFKHDEPLDPEGFVKDYAARKFGFTEEDAEVLWSYFTMPQEIVSARTGKDAKGVPVGEVIARAEKMKKEMDALRPSANRNEIRHLRLMLDIRLNYLKFKQCESEYESAGYDASCRPGLAKSMKVICREGRRIDRRFARLNRKFLKPGEIRYIQELRGGKMEAFYFALTRRD